MVICVIIIFFYNESFFCQKNKGRMDFEKKMWKRAMISTNAVVCGKPPPQIWIAPPFEHKNTKRMA
jgi:hypothetical protein